MTSRALSRHCERSEAIQPFFAPSVGAGFNPPSSREQDGEIAAHPWVLAMADTRMGCVIDRYAWYGERA